MWHPDIPELQLSWDATSLKCIQHCPRRYFYEIVLGYKTEKESHHLVFGRHYHSSLEAYDHAVSVGVPWENAQDIAVHQALRLSYGWESGDAAKQRFSLWRSVQWYTEQFRPETDRVKPVLNDGKAMLEQGFSFQLPFTAPGAHDYMGCGYFDGVVEAMGGIYVRERKTTGKTLNADWFRTFDVDCQIDMYTTAGKVVFDYPVRGVLIDGAQVTINFSRYGRAPSTRTEPQLEEFLDDVGQWIMMAESYATNRYWPKATRFCFMCPFQSVCSKDPASRIGALIGEFRIDDWDPTLERSEV
jgi:hypothetical protein